MHGTFAEDDDWEATGNHLAFIYPDMETAFLGDFKHFVMNEAVEAEVSEVSCGQNGFVVVTKFEKKQGPKYFYKPPTNESFGAGPFGN